VAKLRLRLTSARLRGRTITMRLRASRNARIRPTVRRSGRKVASGSSRLVTTRTLRVRVNRRIRRGRTYTVRIVAYTGKRVAAAASVRMRVR
jgi:hypothetical protein